MRKFIDEIYKLLTQNRFIKILIILIGVAGGLYSFWPKLDSQNLEFNNSFNSENVVGEIENKAPVINSIQTIGQSGGFNTINIIASSTNANRSIFKVSVVGRYFLSGDKYEIDYNFTPTTNKNNPIIFALDVGVGQVKLETANHMIKKDLYHPNPDDKKLPFTGMLSNKDREHLYQYVIEPKYNIRFAAAYIRDLINVWAKHIDLRKRPEIIATLYSKGYGDPKSNPAASERGAQIMKEFYPLAKKWL